MKISSCSRPTRTATSTASARPAEVSNVAWETTPLSPMSAGAVSPLRFVASIPTALWTMAAKRCSTSLPSRDSRIPSSATSAVLRVLVENDLADQIGQRGVAERRIARVERPPEAGGNGRLRGEEPLAPHREARPEDPRAQRPRSGEILTGRRGRRDRPRRYRGRRRRTGGLVVVAAAGNHADDEREGQCEQRTAHLLMVRRMGSP